jgi:hypothetical protein
MKCKECGEPIGKDEIRVFIPECCNVDVGDFGHFHQECEMYHEAIENGLLFEDVVTRVFRVLTRVMKDFVRDAELDELNFSIVNTAVAKLNKEVRAAIGNAGGAQ